jgi:hypothetical protein
MRLAFRDFGEPGLGPITSIRLAFLVREALKKVAVPATTESEVLDEVWVRRWEIEDRMTDVISEYSEAEAVWRLRRRSTAVVGAVGRVLWVTGWAGAILSFLMVLELGYSLADPRWSAFLPAIVVGFGLRRGADTMRRAVFGRRWEAYDRLIRGPMLEEIVALVNKIVYREDERVKGALFYPMPSPTLVEFEADAVVDSESFEEVRALVEGHVTSAIGVAGTRGVGKSTLLRLLCAAPERVSVYLPVPADSAGEQFIKVIYGTTVKQVISSRGGELTGRRWTLFRRHSEDYVNAALQALDRIERSTTRQRVGKVGMSRYGLTAERSGQTTWTERELTRGDWVADFRQYVDVHRRRSGPPLLVTIDELDKITDPAQAIDVINSIKELFHIPGVHFVVSVSDDALNSFATRGVPVRDVFDTAFDAVIEVGRLPAKKSYELLHRRQPRFPYPAALFCHAWSGGLPRDLVRTARSCATLTNRGADPIPVSELAHVIVRRDVTELVDAAIRGERHRFGVENLEALLILRRAVHDTSAPPHEILEAREPISDELASLTVYLDIAATVSAYYSIPRDPEHWAEGINSGEFLDAADLLADAKAALNLHPSEAAWRLTVARDELKLAKK